jgi:hypothetical protein
MLSPFLGLLLTVADMSGQGNTGTLVSMSTTSSPVPGKIGQALNFNGSTNFINMGNVLHPTGAFTYSAWNLSNQSKSCWKRSRDYGEVE